MAKRLELQTLLENLLGSRNVYFQPPANVQMKYPAIVYGRENAKSVPADNISYLYKTRYQVTVIDRNPDSDVVEVIGRLPMCTYSRNFKSNDLNHDVFSLYY